MKYTFVLALISFVVWGTSCNTTSFGSATSDLSTPSVSSNSTPTNLPDAGSIKPDGWVVPQLQCEVEQFQSEKRPVVGEDGSEVTLKVAHYRPKSICTYAESSADSSSFLNGNLRLIRIAERKVNDRIFAYIIDALPLSDDRNARPKRQFVYRIFDSDGDGKFETLLSDDFVLKPPRWTLN